MNQGVEILLSRMDSNPEEFLTGNKAGKWQHLLEKYEEYMTDEERKAVFAKYHALKMSKFTEVVLKELLEEDDGVSLYSFGAAPIKAEGAPIKYDGAYTTTVGYGNTKKKTK